MVGVIKQLTFGEGVAISSPTDGDPIIFPAQVGFEGFSSDGTGGAYGSIGGFGAAPNDRGLNSIISGSTGGLLIEGNGNGHLVLGLRANGSTDSFAIVSNRTDLGSAWGTGASTDYDTVLFKVPASGSIEIQDGLIVDPGATKGGAAGTTGYYTLDENQMSFTTDVTNGASQLLLRDADNSSTRHVIQCFGSWDVGTASGTETFYTASDGTLGLPTYSNGTLSVSSGVVTSSSDASLKREINDYQAGRDQVLALMPKTFKWDTDYIDSEEEMAGFIANEVKEVLPHAVGGKEGNYGLHDRPILAALVNGFKEQDSIIMAMDKRIKELEEKLDGR